MKLEGTKHNTGAHICAWAFLILALMLLTGCGAAPSAGGSADTGAGYSGSSGGGDTDTDSASTDSSNGGDTVASTVVADEPFESATKVALADNATEIISGEISPGNPVEVFDIGSVAVGDRLIVTVEANSSLDPVLAVFDANGDGMITNDDRSYYGGDFNSAIDMPSRRDTAHCYVAVAASYGSGTRGSYLLSVRCVPGGVPPEPNPQLVYLNFDGADGVTIGRRPPVNIPVFEGSLIGEEFSGKTALLIEQIVAQVRQDYIGLNVEFVSSREEIDPTEPHTTVHFGAYDPALLGIAEYVDEFNQALSQQAIIYVDTFQAFIPLNPSVEEMANALSNVASHEAGHLLGLNHTEDAREIMDITANLRQMLASQAFRRSPYHPEVFPIGHQNAGLLLVEAVGGDLALFKLAAAEQLTMRAAWYDEGEPIPARLNRPFSTCFCPKCAKHRHLHERSGRTESATEPD